MHHVFRLCMPSWTRGGRPFTWKSSFGTANQHYLGPEEAWAGMDVGVVPRGQGRYVLSALRILEHLGSDPVADTLLYNLIRWTAG